MELRRGPWLGAAAVLLLAGASAAAAVALHWLPCRGSMFTGAHGEGRGSDFSDACLQTMDNGFSFLYPAGPVGRWEAESVGGALAAVLAGVAWLRVLVPSRWSVTTKLVAASPALATWATALFSLVAAGSASSSEVRSYDALLLAPNVLAVVAFVTVALREVSTDSTLLRVALLLGGTTAFGLVQAVADYAVSASVSYANWDTPPGTGYPTVLGIALAAALLVVLTLRRTPAPAGEPAPRALSRPAGTRAG